MKFIKHMSRLGKLPIILPPNTSAQLADGWLTVKGPKGELKIELVPAVQATITDGQISITVSNPDNGRERALWGLFRSLIKNMVEGVTVGWQRQLEINGVGYKVAAAGNKLNFSLGFSHPVEFPLPDGISAQVEGNKITISGIDKQLVGETAAQIRRLRPPEPYKGKGIKYVEEVIRRKAGKTAVSK